MPQSEEDIESVLGGQKRFKEVQAAHAQVAEMLSEDCSHLLRKAQAALSKASSAAK